MLAPCPNLPRHGQENGAAVEINSHLRAVWRSRFGCDLSPRIAERKIGGDRPCEWRECQAADVT